MDFSHVQNTHRSMLEPSLVMQNQEESQNVDENAGETESYGVKLDSQSLKSLSVNKFGITSEQLTNA